MTSMALPLLLLLLLAGGVLSSDGYKQCPPCGNTTVPIPFSTFRDCGDTQYTIECKISSSGVGRLKFFTRDGNISYPISSISTETQRLVIQLISPNLLSTNTCIPTTDYGLHLNESGPFIFTTSNTILYLNCRKSLLLLTNSSRGFPLMNCSSDSLCHLYVNRTPACRSSSLTTTCCTFHPTTSYDIDIHGCKGPYQSFVNLQGGLWGEPGVEIGWVPPLEPVCESQKDCDDGWNSTCRAPVNGTRRCYCDLGFHWSATKGRCTYDGTVQKQDGGLHFYKVVVKYLALILILLVLIIAVVAIVRKKLTLNRFNDEEGASNTNSTPKIFTRREIRKATKNFSKRRIIGTGGFGDVYRGVLSDGRTVAVKRAKPGNLTSVDQINNEISILCQVNHENLVRLHGYCVVEPGDLDAILVYEYITNGSLSDHLHGQAKLSWSQRLNIAQQTADGLAYLHIMSPTKIIHRDVKSANILLDDSFNAKVSDFGIAKTICTSSTSRINTLPQGTPGYIDPEYYMTSRMHLCFYNPDNIGPMV